MCACEKARLSFVGVTQQQSRQAAMKSSVVGKSDILAIADERNVIVSRECSLLMK